MPDRSEPTAEQVQQLVYCAKLGVSLLVEIRDLLLFIAKQEVKLVVSVRDDLIPAVEAENDVIQSAITLMNGLSQQLADAIAANDPAAVQQVLDDINTHKDALAAAVAANTTAAP